MAETATDPGSNPGTAAIAGNLARIRERIAAAAARAGRQPEAVTLVAVSKTHPAAAVAAALAAGQLVFGENRVQEAAAKFPALRAAHPALRLHLIGGLQTNKARDAVRLADMIESLDRPRLADALAQACDRPRWTQRGRESPGQTWPDPGRADGSQADLDLAAARPGARLPELLIEINVGDEAQKSGVGRAAADDFITACRERFGTALRGLMCVPPAGADPAPHFAWLAERAARHALPVVSMGMSADFEIAIAHGATHVRVGTAIFGARPASA